jgi:hypothetical protein
MTAELAPLGPTPAQTLTEDGRVSFVLANNRIIFRMPPAVKQRFRAGGEFCHVEFTGVDTWVVRHAMSIRDAPHGGGGIFDLGDVRFFKKHQTRPGTRDATYTVDPLGQEIRVKLREPLRLVSDDADDADDIAIAQARLAEIDAHPDRVLRGAALLGVRPRGRGALALSSGQGQARRNRDPRLAGAADRVIKFLSLYRSERGIWHYSFKRDGTIYWSSLRTRDEPTARARYAQLQARMKLAEEAHTT